MLSKSGYSEPSLVPPMPWLSKTGPVRPVVQAAGNGGKLDVRWKAGDSNTAKFAVMGRFGSKWHMLRVMPGGSAGVDLKNGSKGMPEAISVSAVDRYGNISGPVVLAR